MTGLSRLLAHPLTRGLHPDDPVTTAVRRQLIRGKPFLRRIYLEWYRKIANALHQAGVPLMAGSDTPHPFQIWGFGLTREIEALREAGLSNIAALRAATVVPRDYLRSLPGQGSALGWKAEFGTVEPGARADLLLLGADPTRDLVALRAIEAVVAGGRVYDSARLASMLREAGAAGKAQPAPTPGAP